MMSMTWCKPKYTACSVCGVHFDPVIGFDARWGNLCPFHRKLVKERDMQKDRVVYWAKDNWERLAKTMDAEYAEQCAAQVKAAQQMGAYQGAPRQGGYLDNEMMGRSGVPSTEGYRNE